MGFSTCQWGGAGGSLLRSRVDQLLQVDVVTGKCIKRAGVGK